MTSSLHFAQWNGEAEGIIRAVKDLLRKAKDSYLALSYRDTPGLTGFSPVQLLMGRQLVFRRERSSFVPTALRETALQAKMRFT